MEANRRGGLFAARADAGDDIVRIFADGAARGGRRFGKSLRD